MSKETMAYESGMKQGRRAAGKLKERMDALFDSWRVSNPASAQMDYAKEVLALDRLRMDSPPALAKFPETRGWADIVRAERKGFQDGAGCDEMGVAFHFTAWYFMWNRLYTRYVGTPDTPAVPQGTSHCTAIFIRESAEGGPLYGRNWDECNLPGRDVQPPRRGPDGKRRLWNKGVSCAMFCDEEPQDIFPIKAWDVLPEDCRKVPEVTKFLERYVDFWGPHNGIIVDEDLNCVAYEKTTRRVAWRYSDDGTATVTACAQIIPEIMKHRRECQRKSMKLRGLDETSADWQYWTGAEARYHRLLGLVKEAVKRPGGPTLKDLGNIVTDRAAPHPAHVCLAGESCHPSIAEGTGEWTMRSRAAVLHGPNRRTLFWRVEGKQGCFENPPFLILGEGVEMRPEWKAGTRAAPPAVGPDDELEKYRQFEFDYPNEYPL